MRKNLPKIIKYVTFGLYAAVMIFLLFGRTPTNLTVSHSYFDILGMNINLIPFKTVGEYFCDLFRASDQYILRHAVINLGGNIIMFVPLGIFLAAIGEKLRRFPRHLLATAAIIAAVELIQLFTLTGMCDIDDLILNVIGSAIGFVMHAVYCRAKNEIIKKKSENKIG